MTSPSPITIAEAQAILANFSCEQPGDASPEDLRAAIHQVAQATDNQILGILADRWETAVTALTNYGAALALPMPTELPEPQAPLYLKYNPQTGLCYASPYSEQYRGVLIAFQSVEGINELYGHFPLDLFDGASAR